MVLEGCAGGTGWNTAVRRWTELERAYGFETSVSTDPCLDGTKLTFVHSRALPTEGRRAAVAKWTEWGRKPDKPPTVELESIKADWKKWWVALAPEWHQKNDVGELVQGGQGLWGDLVHPGANGILMVLLVLVWWREKEESASESWLAAVRDVGWVLDELLAEAEIR
ncbi:hypothetical protein DFH07DRAFT_731905 [Mycena maculata]|uniref:Uncharacterized protein n=1 Tax=Mycena maculata TaxID=230809 RepID=A0AAD7NV96_9AGAR|nr:hypothetical protein DFH07DRAFT_731905 [Mycena maculata]